MISINPQDPRPLYEQIEDNFSKFITAGIMVPDEKLPSVRSLASQLAINPNTIQRAYRELEAKGYIYSVSGKGSFVSDASEARDSRKNELLEQFDSLAAELLELGCSADELIDRVGKKGLDTASHSRKDDSL